MAAKIGAIDATDFIFRYVPDVVKELTTVVYDLDLLKKRGYNIKNGKVFTHVGILFATSVESAFANLGLKSRTLQPGTIYLTADRRTIPNPDKAVERNGLYFFTDTLSVEE